MFRSVVLTTVAATTVALGTALVLPQAAKADPGAPGCAVQDAWADTASGVVLWSVTCDETRDIGVDATAWHGDADHHEQVSNQFVEHRVEAGDTWTAVMSFERDTVPTTDRIAAQVMSWVDHGDITEPPAILATVQG